MKFISVTLEGGKALLDATLIDEVWVSPTTYKTCISTTRRAENAWLECSETVDQIEEKLQRAFASELHWFPLLLGKPETINGGPISRGNKPARG